MPAPKPSIEQIVALYRERQAFYRAWHEQQREDQRFYDLEFQIATSETPEAFDQIRPPSATTIVDLSAAHAAGNVPRLHVPRRKETAQAEAQTTLMEKAASGAWYRWGQGAPRNIMRAMAQSGALRGAIGARLLYDPDAWPDLPQPSKYGGTQSEEYQQALEEAEADRRSAWPFRLDPVDPIDLYPDPATEGHTDIIHAYVAEAYAIKRDWPSWDMRLPGRDEPLKDTDKVEFIAYHDKTWRAYIVAGEGALAVTGKGLLPGGGVVKHGYGFLPYFFCSGGFGSPFGRPEHRYRGILTNSRDLLKLEARRMTHLDAIIAQQAFPWVIVKQGIEPNMSLMGVTRVPFDMDPEKAVAMMRPVVPVQELILELRTVRDAIQRATIPDALGSEPNKSEESGYLRSLKIGTGRAYIRALSGALEQAVQWATSGWFRLVENKIAAPVSVWGRGMGDEREFVTLRPKDINGHYEVYASVVPSLPNDESVDIANGMKLLSVGAIPVRDLLETYAGRENADELLRERLGEDVLKSPQMMQQLIAQAIAQPTTGVTGGPLGTPGFTSGVLGLGQPQQPVGATATANPQSNAGVGAPRSIPTPPPAPGSLAEANNIIGRSGNGGSPQGISGPLQGIQRG